jgi:hypothetical protein
LKARSVGLDIARNCELFEIASLLEVHLKLCFRRKFDPKTRVGQDGEIVYSKKGDREHSIGEEGLVFSILSHLIRLPVPPLASELVLLLKKKIKQVHGAKLGFCRSIKETFFSIFMSA